MLNVVQQLNVFSDGRFLYIFMLFLCSVDCGWNPLEAHAIREKEKP